MSMLSAQRDKLRLIADNLSDMDYHDYASEVRDAADTIWQLRNDYLSLHRENEKLLKSVRDLLVCIKHEECEESCPYFDPVYESYGYERHGSIVVGEDYLGCCQVGLENCNSSLFDTDEYLKELGIKVDHHE